MIESSYFRRRKLEMKGCYLKKQIEEELQQSEAQFREQAQQLQQGNKELKQAQFKLIQAEKMSSLAQLITGIANWSKRDRI